MLQGGTVVNAGVDAEEGGANGESTTSAAVREADVVDLMEKILISPYTNNNIRGFVLTAVTKLSTRFTEGEQLRRIRNVLSSFDQSIELELQQRAIEFGKLLELDGLRSGVLERMPPPEIRATVMGTGTYFPALSVESVLIRSGYIQ